MPWWEILDDPDLYTTQGVLLWAAVFTVVALALAFLLAFLWQRWKESKKEKSRAP